MNKEQILINEYTTQQIIKMLDLLPDILFWVKDTSAYFIYGNQAFLEHHGIKKIEQLQGKNDYDLTPVYLAKQYASDDAKVKAGEEITNRLEMNLMTDGEVAWFSTSKRAILNSDGVFIGSYGITRHFTKLSKAFSNINAVEAPVEFIRQHYHEAITIEQIAKISHLSVSALERRFKKHLGKTPKQFIHDVRLESARRLLIETNSPIAQIAYDTGFSDHSYFSKQFKTFFGELPSDFREAYTA